MLWLASCFHLLLFLVIHRGNFVALPALLLCHIAPFECTVAQQHCTVALALATLPDQPAPSALGLAMNSLLQLMLHPGASAARSRLHPLYSEAVPVIATEP